MRCEVTGGRPGAQASPRWPQLLTPAQACARKGCGELLLAGNQRQFGAGPGGGSSSEGLAGLSSLECMKAARREVRGQGTGPILSGSLLFRTSCQAAQGIVGMSQVG